MQPMTSRSMFALVIAAPALLLSPPIAGADENPAWVKVDASTPEQIVHALWTADSTRTPTVIAVAPGRYVFSRVFETPVGPSFLPAIDTRVWIVGRDAATTILEPGAPAGAPGAVPEGRIITVLERGYVVIRNLTLTRFGFEAGEASEGGGAAANFGGFLRFDSSRLTSNATGNADGSAAGGAILNASGRLHVDSVALTGNRVTGRGGAIALIGGSAVIRRTIVRENTASEVLGAGGVGGGIYSGGYLTIIGSTIAGNLAGDIGGLSRAGAGGGVYNDREGTLRLRDSAVIDNGVEFIGRGGGIGNYGSMSLENATVAGNYAGTFGAGVFNEGRLSLEGATIFDNEVLGNVLGCDPMPCSGGGGLWSDDAGRVRSARTVVAGNRNGFGPPDSVGPDCVGVLISGGYNAVEDSSGCDLVPFRAKRPPSGDLLGVDPRLAERSDDGEPGNAHHPLLPQSPLIDAGGRMSAICTPFDQIGQRRVDADHDRKRECDIGAIEYPGP